MKSKKRGFFHTEFINDKWWLIDPKGNLFLSKGICNINFCGDKIWQREHSPYNENIIKKYGDREKWLEEVSKRFKNWKFNSLGAWCCERELRKKIAYTEILDIAQEAARKYIWASGDFPDVFAPEFEKVADEICQKQCLPKKNDSLLIGYFTDNELHWQPDWRSSDSLLSFFLKLPRGTAGFIKAEKFLKNMDRKRKEVTKKDELEFLKIVAKRYFQICFESIKRYDPNHLILGCRFGEVPQGEGHSPLPHEIFESMQPFVDIFSYNCYYLVKNLEDEQKLNGILQEYIEQFKKPILITEFSFLGADSGYPTKWPQNDNTYPKPGILEVQLPTQTARARALEQYIMALLKNTNIVGYHWFQYVDYPFEGRNNDGVAANFGLVKIDDEPWEKLAETFQKVNLKAESIHSK